MVQWPTEDTNLVNHGLKPLALHHFLCPFPTVAIHWSLETYGTHLILTPCRKTSSVERQLLCVPSFLFSWSPFLHCFQQFLSWVGFRASKNLLTVFWWCSDTLLSFSNVALRVIQMPAGTSSAQRAIMRL